MTGERNALQAEAKETTRKLETIRARYEAAAQRTAELEQEREALRVEAKQLTQDLEKARRATAAVRDKGSTHETENRTLVH